MANGKVDPMLKLILMGLTWSTGLFTFGDCLDLYLLLIIKLHT